MGTALRLLGAGHGDMGASENFGVPILGLGSLRIRFLLFRVLC